MKKAVLILIVCCLFVPVSFAAATEKNPKTVNYFLHWSITDSEAKELAKWDFLVLDMEVQENSPSQLRLIRQLNPRIKIVAYIASQNLFEPDYDSNESVLRKKINQSINDSWWLRDESGNRLSDWPNTHIFNVTDYCPQNDLGQRFNDFLPQFVADNIESSGMWDGVFYDDVWNGASWFNNGNISLLNNGQRNSAVELNNAWINGIKKIFNKTRILWPKAIIVGNGSFANDYNNYLNGWMLENFPTPWENGGTWSGVIKSYLKFSSSSKNYNIINGFSNNQNDYRDFRYGLTSALLGDGYYSFDYGSADHAQLWWYDEYDNNLGSKQAPAYNLLDKNNQTIKPGLWRRDFTGGIALVNSTDKEQKYAFTKEQFEHLRGNQDKIINNGQNVNWIRLAPHDGVILLKQSVLIYNNWFSNGNFFRVYNNKGSQIRNGFFAYLDNYQGSQTLLLLNDGRVLSSSGGYLNILNNGKKILSFKPYGNFKGNFAIAVGNLDKDNSLEIITGAGSGGGPQVRIFKANGKVISSFMAYDKNFRGGVNIAVGDVDGDGSNEIITGAGSGGGPQVKIFNASGKLKGSFMAYDKNFREGISVAAYDINGDGLSEILTGISNF